MKYGLKSLLIVSIMILAGNNAYAACKNPLPNAYVIDFTTHGSTFLKRNPNGGESLAQTISEFASQNHATLMAIRKLALTANELQKQAIGQGLAISATFCLTRDTATAREINDVALAIPDQDVVNAYIQFIDDNSADPPPETADNAKPKETSLSPTGTGNKIYTPDSTDGFLAIPNTELPKIEDLNKPQSESIK